MRIALALVLLLSAGALITSCSPKETETPVEHNTRVLLENFDIKESAAEGIAKTIDSCGIGTIENIYDKRHSKYGLRFYIEDDKGETYYLTLSPRGSFGTLFKGGPEGEALISGPEV
jgi:hypothetical protein